MACEWMVALLNGMGQVVRLLGAKLESFRAEDDAVLWAGLVDSTFGLPEPTARRGDRDRGLLGGAVVVSDDAGPFRVGKHALCWCTLNPKAIGRRI